MYLKSWRTWLFLGYISLVMYLSLTPGNELSWFSKLWKYDKVVHFTEYLGVGFLMINMLMIQPLKKIHWQCAMVFLLLFPLFDGSNFIHQGEFQISMMVLRIYVVDLLELI